MRRPLVALALLTGIVLVGVENWLYFSSGEDAPRRRTLVEELEEEHAAPDPEEEETGGPTHLPPLDPDTYAALLSSFESARSPFLPEAPPEGVVTTTSTGLPLLDGTLIGRDRRIAWVGGRPWAEGEWLGEYLLLRIEKGHVVLEREGERYTVRISLAPAGEDAEEPIGGRSREEAASHEERS